MIYPGKLGKPYPYQKPPGLLTSDEQRNAWVVKQVEAWRVRMNDLCAFYGIESDNWNLLAVKLAEAHVPGMRMEKAPRGQQSKWKVFDRAEVRATIDDM